MPIHPGAPNGGRPKGARNKFDAHVYATVLAFLQHKFGEPEPEEYAKTNLWLSLNLALRAGKLLPEVTRMLAKQVSFEHTNVTELPDDWLARLIEDRRAELKLIELKAEPMPESLPNAQ